VGACPLPPAIPSQLSTAGRDPARGLRPAGPGPVFKFCFRHRIRGAAAERKMGKPLAEQENWRKAHRRTHIPAGTHTRRHTLRDRDRHRIRLLLLRRLPPPRRRVQKLAAGADSVEHWATGGDAAEPEPAAAQPMMLRFRSPNQVRRSAPPPKHHPHSSIYQGLRPLPRRSVRHARRGQGWRVRLGPSHLAPRSPAE
jgi:hypothetical protein